MTTKEIESKLTELLKDLWAHIGRAADAQNADKTAFKLSEESSPYRSRRRKGEAANSIRYACDYDKMRIQLMNIAAWNLTEAELITEKAIPIMDMLTDDHRRELWYHAFGIKCES